MAVAFKKHRFSASEFMQLHQSGILDPDLRCELIAGEIVEMPPINPPHAAIVDRLTRMLAVRLDGRATVRVQNPIRLDNRSLPLPDIALLVPRADYYTTYHPDPQTIYLVIEVADTTLRYDLEIKTPLYAEAGIRELWVIDVNTRCIHVHLQPQGNRYLWHVTFESGTVEIDALGETFTIEELLG